jgi:hypothetical protein
VELAESCSCSQVDFENLAVCSSGKLILTELVSSVEEPHVGGGEQGFQSARQNK